MFSSELEFEEALVEHLRTNCGWNGEILNRPTEDDLVKNWARALFANNNTVDRLNGEPLNGEEMRRILEQIARLRTPLHLNGFINGGTVSVKREHSGKEASLKIYDRREIACGDSSYQIARQPRFKTTNPLASDRRGDLMLLINGMPVIAIELKKSGVPVSQAAYQIQKYSGEGVYSGIFALAQIFVAMTPEETLYFANPGPDGTFNPNYFFHWADFDNEPINDWRRIGSTLLSIPMAHQLVGFYTVADGSDGVLKVMRSYQYYAANAVSDRVANADWGKKDQLGGYVWHTTGSGKTMTSFKSAQLIASSRDADKVVFLVDRIELGTQSLREYRNFEGAGLDERQKANTVQETEDSSTLVAKLKSDATSNTLIVTSIQKMSMIGDDCELRNRRSADLERIRKKRIVFIVDECHRSTFGDMLARIKETFPKAIFFGFSGTPIQDENKKKDSSTATIFGDELHRYSIADGIRDGNVLGFDPYKVCTFRDEDVRRRVALEKAKARTEEEAIADPKKSKVFYRFMNDVPMAGFDDSDGEYVKGIEDYLPESQYGDKDFGTHREMVVKDVAEHWTVVSRGGKFHAILATSSIREAIWYYRLFKERAPQIKTSALFDPNIDNDGGAEDKEEGLLEIIADYNGRYGTIFTAKTFGDMKKDIAARLAHKRPYERIENDPAKRIDLLIVVDQMLTGFDSKWINALYLDKNPRYENIIQAFSRTNRLFGPDKPFGTIKYYRRPHTMERDIARAVKLYSGDRPFGLFVDRLPKNIERMNSLFDEINDLFVDSGIENFESLPSEIPARRKFAKLFKEFNRALEAARVQGFVWGVPYEWEDEETGENKRIEAKIDESTYLVLAKRYKEMFSKSGASPDETPPYEIDGSLLTIKTDRIDADYMNMRFEKYLVLLQAEGANAEELRRGEDELHRTFATLSQEEQKFADILLREVQSGSFKPIPGKTFREIVVERATEAKTERIRRIAVELGIDERKLRAFLNSDVDENNINEYGRLDELENSADRTRAKEFFETREDRKLAVWEIKRRLHEFLKDLILRGDVDGEQEDF